MSTMDMTDARRDELLAIAATAQAAGGTFLMMAGVLGVAAATRDESSLTEVLDMSRLADIKSLIDTIIQIATPEATTDPNR